MPNPDFNFILEGIIRELSYYDEFDAVPWNELGETWNPLSRESMAKELQAKAKEMAKNNAASSHTTEPHKEEPKKAEEPKAEPTEGPRAKPDKEPEVSKKMKSSSAEKIKSINRHMFMKRATGPQRYSLKANLASMHAHRTGSKLSHSVAAFGHHRASQSHKQAGDLRRAEIHAKRHQKHLKKSASAPSDYKHEPSLAGVQKWRDG